MRNLRTMTTAEEASKELRADEILVPSGGVDGYNFFSAMNDEDCAPSKGAKLEFRRRVRKQRRFQKETGTSFGVREGLFGEQ